MKTFISEYRELLKWYVEELGKIPDIPSQGYDGWTAGEQRALGAEYRKKLRALREKYNVEQTK